MFMPAGAPQAVRNLSVTDPTAVRAKAVVPWRALVAVVLRSLVLGTLTSLVLVAAASASCPTPPSGDWTGAYSSNNVNSSGSSAAPSVVVGPETYLGSETFEFT